MPVDERLFSVYVPIASLNSKVSKIKIQVSREPDKTGATMGQITSWWVDENNLMNPDLIIPQSALSPAPTSSTSNLNP